MADCTSDKVVHCCETQIHSTPDAIGTTGSFTNLEEGKFVQESRLNHFDEEYDAELPENALNSEDKSLAPETDADSRRTSVDHDDAVSSEHNFATNHVVEACPESCLLDQNSQRHVEIRTVEMSEEIVKPIGNLSMERRRSNAAILRIQQEERRVSLISEHALMVASSGCGSMDVREALEKEVEPKVIAPDGGWGWAVLAGSFYIAGFMINITICFGILFSRKMEELQVSSAQISYIFMFHSVMWNFGIMLSNSLVRNFGYRPVAFVGCLVASLSFMLLAFSTSQAYIFIMYSVILPVSGGIGSTVHFLIVPLYFEKRRGLAMAIMMTGIAVGGIVSPLLIRNLQDNFGFFWATLIHGAVILNCCVAAALFRPLPQPGKTKLRNQLSSFEEQELLKDGPSKDQEPVNPKIHRTPRQQNKLHSRIITPVLKWFKETFSVLRRGKVLMNGFTLSTAMVGYFNFLMLVPFAVEDAGHSPAFAAQCVAVCSVTNAGSRLLVAFAADRPWFNRTFAFGLGAFLSCLNIAVFAVSTESETWMTCLMLAFGSGIGMFMSLFHVHMIDVLGMQLYAAAVGVNALIMASTFAISGPIFGMIRNHSTSYMGSLLACSSLLGISTILILGLHSSHILARFKS